MLVAAVMIHIVVLVITCSLAYTPDLVSPFLHFNIIVALSAAGVLGLTSVLVFYWSSVYVFELSFGFYLTLIVPILDLCAVLNFRFSRLALKQRRVPECVVCLLHF